MVLSPRSALVPPVTRAAAALVALLSALAALTAAPPAQARDIVHVVHQGQNLSMIARRYHTTVAAIRRQNGLRPGQTLRPGAKLRIEEVEAHRRWRRHFEKEIAPPPPKPQAAAAAKAERREKPITKGLLPGKSAPAAKSVEEPPAKREPENPWARRGAKPGRVILVRHREVVRAQLVDDGKLDERTAKRLDRLFRSRRTGAAHPIDRRLLRLLAQVSDHFGGRSIIVVSGFRPYAQRQFTRNSRHNHGAAIDFRIAGVPESDVFDYCRTLTNVGCGHYPTSHFVHMDVRRYKTQWVDYAGPGQAPRYARRSSSAANDDAHQKGSTPH